MSTASIAAVLTVHLVGHKGRSPGPPIDNSRLNSLSTLLRLGEYLINCIMLSRAALIGVHFLQLLVSTGSNSEPNSEL